MDARDCDMLAARSRNGDPRALAVLYREFAPPLLGYLRRIVSDRAEAEDLLHTLEHLDTVPRVTVAPDVAVGARAALARMLALP